MTARRLTVLVFLAAASMVLQYAAQGALAAGFNPREFGDWFWYADAVLWGLRALIDAAVIVSLFQTQARNARDARLLAAFEVAMITLIAATMGPALVAIARSQSIDATLPPTLRWVWAFLIAAYSPLMIGAAGTAYKIQTAAVPLPTTAIPAVAPFPSTVNRSKRDLVRQLREEHPGWTVAQLAAAAGCDVSTVHRAMKHGQGVDGL